jgi:type I restriction enzyme S subunit
MNEELRMKEDWVESTIINVCDIHDNLRKPINSKERNNRINGKKPNELYPYYGATGQVGYIDDYLTDGDYILLGEDAAPFLDYSKDVAYKISGKTWVNNHAHILKSKFYDDYLLHYLNHFNYRNYVSGTTRLKLTQGRLKQIPVIIPPLVEQKAIVKKIEELFSSLDSGITDLKKAQDQLVIYRQAVLKKAFEGELSKEWREKQSNLTSADNLLEQIKEERQKKNEQQLADWKQAVKLWDENKKKPVKPKFIKELTPLTNEELEQLPSLNKYWQWVKADKFASHEGSSLKAGPFGSSLKKEFYTESGYKIYGQEQVISNNHKLGDYYVNQEKYESLINCAIKPFDILISLVGTVGKVLVLPKDCEDGIINPRLVKISLNKFYDSIFFKYYFESAFLKSIYSIKAHGATMDILNLGIIKELPYPLCSKQEQHQIVLEIESRLSVCDKVEESIKESLEKAQALRQSILKKAFEGKLLTKDEIAKCKAQPEYEPAGALLERIKKEKTKK